MRRRGKILLLSACGLVAVVGVCWFCFREDEPSYNGRTLSEWLERYDPFLTYPQRRAPIIPPLWGNKAVREEARIAVLNISTNAAPTVARWSQATDSVIEISLHRFVNTCFGAHQPSWLRQYLWRHSAERKRALASEANEVLIANLFWDSRPYRTNK